MRSSMPARSAVVLMCAIIFGSVALPGLHAAVTIDVGDNRALATNFLQEQYGISESAARSLMRHHEQLHGDRIINSLELPAGAVMDFVRVDGEAGNPASTVTYEGSGVLREARHDLFFPHVERMLEEVPADQRRHVLDNIAAAIERGWFVQTLTREQRDALMRNNRLPGEEIVTPQQVRRVRLLVVLNNFPRWDDRSPGPGSGNYDQGGDREHPVSVANNWYTPGGPLDNTSNYQPGGLTSPAWSHTGTSPTGGSNSAVSNHPRLEYRENGQVGTAVHLQERWFNLLFDTNNPRSISRYYFANSHGNLSIEGNRSDIVGPLESRHQLDRVSHVPGVGGIGFDYAHQPGTPVIRRIPEPPPAQLPYGVPNLRGLSADSSRNIIGTLGYTGGVHISGLQRQTAGTGDWAALAINAVRVDPFDNRRRIFETAAFNDNDNLRAVIGGVARSIPVNQGFNLDASQGSGASLLNSADVLGNAPGNRLLSLCYYTHDHRAQDRAMGSRPYQLRHLRSNYSSSIIDDILGTSQSSLDHYARPKPYDHDITDHSHPNMGFFEHPNSNGGHNYQVWLGHLSQVLNDHGISPTGYNARINLYPSDSAAGQDQGGTSGPWSGPHVFIPNSAVVLPSDAGLYLTAHELGHALMGWPDLYDLDFYYNAQGVQPPRFISNMMGPYSVMADGFRVDAFLKTLSGWVTPIAVTSDIVRAEIPEIEGTLRDPIVYKLPGRPHYIAEGVHPDDWQEFFLVENRNRTGEAYFGDQGYRGLYIYRVDLRFDQRDEAHPMVIIEQADGLNEMQRNPRYDWGDMSGDPFPGSTNNRHFNQFSTPSSWSHGWVSGIGPNMVAPRAEEPSPSPGGVLQPGSSTDSFSRVVNISDAGAMMRADLHVVPREVVVTAPPIPDMPREVMQGEEDFLVMHLNLHNDSAAPNLSRDDVQISSIRIDENGSSQDDADILRVSLWDDTNRNGEFDPQVDTRIATAFFQNQVAVFTDLHYPVPLNEARDLFITYDISPMANSDEGVTIGAGIEAFDYIMPDTPGAVQRRVRDTSPDRLGAHRFPLQSQLVRIVERPDTLLVEPISRTPGTPPAMPGGAAGPAAIEPGQQNVPIMSLNLSVDQGSVTVTRLRVDQTGTMDGVAHITSARVYLDRNADGVVDGGDQLLGETRFAMVAGVQRASFDIAQNPVTVTEDSPQSLLLTASLSENMPVLEPPDTLTLVYTLVDPNYVTLQHPDDVVSPENFPMSSDAIATPEPDAPPAPPTNLTATNLADGSIMLQWNLSPDDPAVGGEEDVVRYHIYRAQDAANLPEAEPMTFHTTVAAGISEFNDLTAPLGVNFFYMLRAYDEAGQEGPNSNIAGPISASDEAPPVFSEFDPAQGASGVPRDTTISFVMEDTGAGVDSSTLVFEVDGVDVADAPETTIAGTPRRFTVEYNPPEPYDYLQEVNVRLQVADLAGNVAPGDGQFLSYSFTAEAPPTQSISGLITDQAGQAVEGVRVHAGPQSARTDADGVYEITGLAAGSYSVRPELRGWSFEPAQMPVTVPPDAFAINFRAGPGFDISGQVRDSDGAPLSGVTVTDGERESLTGADGRYAFRDVPAGTYTLQARLDGFAFMPATLQVTVNAQVGGSTNNDFVGAPHMFGVSGTVRTTAGDRLAGIQVQALHNGTVVRTATTNANGVYSIANLAPGSYTIRPVSDDYAFEPVEREFEIATDLANVDFTAASLFRMALPDGTAFVATPVDPLNPDPTAVFGAGVQIARWDPQTGSYVLAPSDNPIMQVALGRGFWTRTSGGAQASIAGEVYPNNQALPLQVMSGWNMLGNPYNRDLPWERMTFPQGSPASRFGFIYDHDANTYRLVSTMAGLGARTSVPRHHGFWLRSAASASLTIAAPGTQPASAEVVEQAARKPAGDAWIIPIVARAANAVDASSLAGVLPHAAGNPEAYRMDNPPAIGDYVDLYFLGDDGRRLAVDVRANAPRQSWQFEVVTNMAGVEVQLQLPDLSEVPNDRVVYLIDEDADRRIYARTSPSYSYNAGDGAARRFRLEVAERTEAGLTISAAAAQSGAGGATITYTLSADAQVSVEVLNIAGRTIAVLAADAVTPAGVATSTWNGRSSSGTLVPSGRYLVRMNARADDGQQTQALVPLQLER